VEMKSKISKGQKKKNGAVKISISGNGKIGAARRLKNRKVVILLFFGVGILVVGLVLLIMSSVGFFEKFEEEKYFDIKDECGIILGNLVHQVRDEGECRLKCVNECDVRGMDFVRFGFEGKIEDCNSCDCWCK